MLNFSFTISPLAKQELEKIQILQSKILLEQVTRNQEIQLKWETVLDRTLDISRLSIHKPARQEVLAALDPQRKKSSANEMAVYSSLFEWLNYEWFLNRDKVDAATVKKVYGKFNTKKGFDEKQVKEILEFIQVNPEHSVIQSGLALILLSRVLGTDTIGLKVVFTISYIFMYKHGFDFRGLLNIEGFFADDFEHFTKLKDSALSGGNLTDFLEYYTLGVGICAEKAYRKIHDKQFKHDIPASFYILSERQKEIMGMFSRPGAKISNKTVQKAFGISQITASRDLSKLNSLGLIFSSGAGRSVYYTRNQP